LLPSGGKMKDDVLLIHDANQALMPHTAGLQMVDVYYLSDVFD